MTISITAHDEHLPDRAAMLVMRTMITLQPASDLGPEGRPAFDDLMEKTTPTDGVDYEQAVLGRVVCPPIAGTNIFVTTAVHCPQTTRTAALACG